ncbi:MAG TPA: hypothetical protein VEQ85_14855 [Lacipirellulaceae bacterium]|nr:hypothetical protein [Lacipirellulaceae bacterium]
MPRHARSRRPWAVLALIAVNCVASTGCIGSILATGLYMWNGGNVVPAECDKLEKQRVVVLCRPPASYEYRNAGAARAIGSRVSAMLSANVEDIDVVSPNEVDNWVDEQDWENFKDLGRAVKATRVVYIELDDFGLNKGKTLYQGTAEINITVYDMTDRGKEIFTRRLGQVLFPRNSGIPAADKPEQQFERQFVEILAQQIAEHFYKHNPNASFALDAMANN